jgi:hypothetical protein
MLVARTRCVCQDRVAVATASAAVELTFKLQVLSGVNEEYLTLRNCRLAWLETQRATSETSDTPGHQPGEGPGSTDRGALFPN